MIRKYSFLLFAFIFQFNYGSAQNDVQKLVASLLGETPLEEDLLYICDQIGGRVTGSAANEASVEWTYNNFKELGISVNKEAFEMPALWLPKSTTSNISGAANFNPTVVSKYQSPPGLYSGQLLDGGKGTAEDFDKIKDQIKDQFVLIESDICLDINGLFAEYTTASRAEFEALRLGAKGIVFMSSRPRGLLYRFISAKAIDNNLPQLVMAREDAQRCLRVLRSGANLDISINIDAETGGSFTSHNVIAEIKGNKYPDEIIVIGSHLDSWALGTGANDNACNVSLMMDIARQIKLLNIKPDRTIRFALWNGEEQGYFGSWAYTRDHLNELSNHKMAMSIDIGSGGIIGFFTNGRDELIPILDRFLKPVEALGNFFNVNAPIVGTDNFDFMLQGVPNLVGNHKAQLYGQNYHASSDTYDKVDLKSLKRNSAIVGAVTLAFANADPADIDLKRQNREEIQAMFEKFNLEFQMRMFNVWDAWISGNRGIK